jgi:hypothetical protein
VQFNQRLEVYLTQEDKRNASWRAAFARVDTDHSGYAHVASSNARLQAQSVSTPRPDDAVMMPRWAGGRARVCRLITYDELGMVARKTLGLRRSDLSDDTLAALWVYLDADCSDHIDEKEFGRFMSLSGPVALKAGALERRQSMIKAQSRKDVIEHLQAKQTAIKTERLTSSVPTASMREELLARGVALPDDEALTTFSFQFNERLEAVLPGKECAHARSSALPPPQQRHSPPLRATLARVCAAWGCGGACLVALG